MESFQFSPVLICQRLQQWVSGAADGLGGLQPVQAAMYRISRQRHLNPSPSMVNSSSSILRSRLGCHRHIRFYPVLNPLIRAPWVRTTGVSLILGIRRFRLTSRTLFLNLSVAHLASEGMDFVGFDSTLGDGAASICCYRLGLSAIVC